MDNITALRPGADATRSARAAYVHQQLKAERWSIRQAALQIGMNHTVLGSRVSGTTAFLADELEAIALLLRREPVEFFADYLGAGPDDSNRRTLVPKVAGSTPVGGTLHNLPTRERSSDERPGLAPVTMITGERVA